MKINKILLTIALLYSFSMLNAQDVIINNEIGVYLGPTFMQTDYGEAKNFGSSINNTGFGFGFAYVADFSDSRVKSGMGVFLTTHVKVRAELSYAKANFAYDGKPVEDGNAETAKFKAMIGSSKLLNIGILPEIYIFDLTNDAKLQPYVLLGASFVSAKPSLKSSLALPTIYQPKEDNVFLDSQSTFSLTAGVGTRYKLDDIDILFEYRFNSFMSDRIEGLDSDFAGDKNNDAQTIFNIGVVFNLY